MSAVLVAFSLCISSSIALRRCMFTFLRETGIKGEGHGLGLGLHGYPDGRRRYDGWLFGTSYPQI